VLKAPSNPNQPS